MKQIVSVGIDVSKGKSTVCAMIHPNTIIKESFEVLHTVEEMSMLADYIGSLDRRNSYCNGINRALSSSGCTISVSKRLFCMC